MLLGELRPQAEGLLWSGRDTTFVTIGPPAARIA